MSWLPSVASNVLLAGFVALMAWFVQRWLRRPAIARTLWVLALIKLVTPPLISMPFGDSPSALSCALGICSCGPHTPLQAILLQVLPWLIFAVWTTGSGAICFATWRRWRRCRRFIECALPADPDWQSLAQRLAAELTIPCPPILVVPGQLPPFVMLTWQGPCVILPAGLLGQLSDAQKSALLLHELVHIKRGDHVVRLLELLVALTYWWLPVLRFMGRQLRACEEACCDTEVVGYLPHARREYATLLLDVLDFADSAAERGVTAHSTAMSASDLEQRLHWILDGTSNARRGWPSAALATLLAVAILPCEFHLNFTRPSSSPALDVSCSAAGPASPSKMKLKSLSRFCCPS